MAHQALPQNLPGNALDGTRLELRRPLFELRYPGAAFARILNLQALQDPRPDLGPLVLFQRQSLPHDLCCRLRHVGRIAPAGSDADRACRTLWEGLPSRSPSGLRALNPPAAPARHPFTAPPPRLQCPREPDGRPLRPVPLLLPLPEEATRMSMSRPRKERRSSGSPPKSRSPRTTASPVETSDGSARS